LQGYYTGPQASWAIQAGGATINSRPRSTIRRATPSLPRPTPEAANDPMPLAA
jgi:hypothetical protein